MTSIALDFIHTHTQTSDLFTKQITLTIENIRNKKGYAKPQKYKKTAFFMLKSQVLDELATDKKGHKRRDAKINLRVKNALQLLIYKPR